MTSTMRAALLTAPGRALDIKRIQIPTPGPGELLVKVEACGICHTDLHVKESASFPPGAPEPLILGHEGIGIVVDRGPGATQVPIGARIGAPWLHDTCEHCRQCLTGYESFCATHRAHGYSVNGAFAEYVIVKERYVPRIPDGLDPVSAAPLMCAGVTAYGALLKADLAPGKTCAIIGCGGLGQYAIQLAKLFGANVIAIDASEAKLDQARRRGADAAILAGPAAGGQIRALGGADACLNFAPTAMIWPMVVEAINPLGWIVSVAMVAEPVQLVLEWLTYNGVRITGTSVGTRQELLDLLALAERHHLHIKTETVDLHDLNDGLERLAAGKVDGRLVIDFQSGKH
jgi:alcohol dehydrogenase, propanol-preferring